ncbi:MAG: hypothetical protein Q9226_007468, partial [Calogaya cf. arnoldii]
GDMNAIDPTEDDFHQTDEVNLRDAWKDTLPPQGLRPKADREEPTYGRAKGVTWGYQSLNEEYQRRRRSDKFYYTGSIEPVAVEDVGDLSGKIGRIGIGLEIEAKVWELNREVLYLKGSYQLVKKKPEFVSQKSAELLQERKRGHDPNLVQKEHNIWVSDHFGIVLGLKIL